MTDAQRLFRDTDRFLIAPHFKTSRRSSLANTTGLTRDGWTLTDVYASTRIRVDTKKDAVKHATLKLSDEQRLDWSEIVAWTAHFGGGYSIGREVYGVNRAGDHAGYIGMVGRSLNDDDAGTRENVARLLDHLGHAGLPEQHPDTRPTRQA